jgi:hypothetical protein
MTSTRYDQKNQQRLAPTEDSMRHQRVNNDFVKAFSIPGTQES